MRWTAYLLCLALLGCYGTNLDFFPHATGYLVLTIPPRLVPASFEAYWADAEACTGLEGDISEVTWFLVRDLTDWDGDGLQGQHYHGLIYLDLATGLDRTVAHEAYHNLLWQNGLDADGGHERLAWDLCDLW